MLSDNCLYVCLCACVCNKHLCLPFFPAESVYWQSGTISSLPNRQPSDFHTHMYRSRQRLIALQHARAVRYIDTYRVTMEKLLSFHIMLDHLFCCVTNHTNYSNGFRYLNNALHFPAHEGYTANK